MANRDDQPFRGLEPDHYRRSGLKDAVSHHLSPPNPLTSTAPQPFPNNLTMPLDVTPPAPATFGRDVEILSTTDPHNVVESRAGAAELTPARLAASPSY